MEDGQTGEVTHHEARQKYFFRNIAKEEKERAAAVCIVLEMHLTISSRTVHFSSQIESLTYLSSSVRKELCLFYIFA